MKHYIRLQTDKKNICQEVTEEIYNKINEMLLIEMEKEELKKDE